MLTGIIFAIASLSILILIHELGHFGAAKKFGLWVKEFGIGLPPRIWRKKIGETIWSVNLLPFGGFVRIYGEDREDEESEQSESRPNIRDAVRSFGLLPIWKRAVIISAGVFMNFLLGWILLSLIFAIGVPPAVLITDVSPGSPAEAVGLKAGDLIVGAGGSPAELGSEIESGKFADIVNGYRGKEMFLKIKRDGDALIAAAVPRLNPPVGEGALGIVMVEAGFPGRNLISALWEGLKTSLMFIVIIFKVIFGLIAGIFTGESAIGEVKGPVGIIKITSETSRLGVLYFIQLLALISLNLAALNIFPFPALDGGRLIFLLIEKFKGSPLPVKFERYANALGMAFLLLFIAVITIKDITQLF